MRRPEELVDRRHALHAVAAGDEDREVARQRAGVAGDGDDIGNVGARDLLRLVLGAGARRIEDEPVEGLELLEGQRPAEQVAPLRRDAPEAGAWRKARSSAATAAASPSTA